MPSGLLFTIFQTRKTESENKVLSPIEQALHDLNGAIERLDAVASGQIEYTIELKEHADQLEMFQSNTQAAQNSNVVHLDPALIVQKLDTTINRVEAILKEG